jgi:signal transduction histidine kinase
VSVAAFSWTAYRRFETALLSGAGDRLLAASRPVALMLEASVNTRAGDLARVATHPAVATLLRGGDREGAAAAIAPLAPDTTRPGVRVEIRDRAGTVLLDVTHGDPPPAPAWIDSVVAGRVVAAGGFYQGPFVSQGNHPFAVAAAPLKIDGQIAGYLLAILPVRGNNVQTIRDLIGPRSLLIIGLPGTPVWTDLERPVAAPPEGLVPGGTLIFDRSAAGPGVGAATALRNSPWVLWVQQPRDLLLAPARRMLVDMGVLAVVIIVAGTVLGWLVSRRVTGPLVRLTEAAERLAADDAPPPDVGGDEVERLGDSFARMATRVRDTHLQLEQRVAERTKRLEQTLAELARAQEQLVEKERLALLGQLAGAVGHELRNPLGVISNALYVLDHTLVDPPALANEYLELIRGQIVISERIIGDLLDTARVRPPQIEPVRVSDLVDSQIRRLGAIQGIDVRVDVPDDMPFVAIDPNQLSQVLLNLLTNAVQAIGETGGVLSVSAYSDGDGRVQIDIQDTGPGIAVELQEKIFEPLFTTKARGLGLGLWVSKALATANHVDLSVRSRPGEGAVFTLEMPIAARRSAAQVA